MLAPSAGGAPQVERSGAPSFGIPNLVASGNGVATGQAYLPEQADWFAAGRALGRTVAQLKATQRWQDEQWRRWPNMEEWPEWLDVFEAAAYLRISPDYIRSRLVTDRAGFAGLAHKKLGSHFRILKADLDRHGNVASRPGW